MTCHDKIAYLSKNIPSTSLTIYGGQHWVTPCAAIMSSDIVVA